MTKSFSIILLGHSEGGMTKEFIVKN